MKIFYLFAMICFWSFAAQAKIEYTVSVPVDVDADNSVQAKDMAMIEAQRKAFLEVAGKLTAAENVEKLNELSDDAIMYFVRSVGVENEKAGGTKYKADLAVEINEQLLKDYMAENEMITADGKEFTVVPVFRAMPNAEPVLWGEDNVWRQKWVSKGLIKFGVMQIRTIKDSNMWQMPDLNAEKALYMDGDMLSRIMQANGTQNVYVVFAEAMENNDLKITVKNVESGTEDTFTVYSGSEKDVLDKAIEKSVMYISNMEREAKNNENVAAVNSINAVYIYQDMKDWLAKSKTIADLEQVEGVDTLSFGGGKVNFAIRYRGSLDNLWYGLQENGFSHEAVGNYFVIR
ncbi:MAG: hypothetical protein ILA52_00240 [Alphaproteobacteria bacterium]|nr:hypothetical protein [Alphaproteobacteria bacterium]